MRDGTQVVALSNRRGTISASINECGRFSRCQENPWHLGQRRGLIEIWSGGSNPHVGHSMNHMRGGLRPDEVWSDSGNGLLIMSHALSIHNSCDTGGA